MDVLSLCPLPVASLRWIDRYGRPVLTFVCRATVELLPVASRLAEQQETPSELDNHWDDDPSRSLYAPTDLAPLKARADVMLVGSAFAPRGEAVRSLRTRLVVGEIDKSIDVHSERVWGQDGSLREGPRFAKMPLRWERAAGGPGTSNPVGVHGDAADAYGQLPVPNLQPPGLDLKGSGDFIPPIGYGPLAPGWPERRDKLRLPLATLFGGAWTQQPLPDDVDPRFFNAAPRDQQVDALRENERLVLENLHPEHPRLVTSLPGIRPRAFAEMGAGPPRELSMVCDTLWINTDSALCTLTWRGQIALEAEGGRIFVALEEPGQRLTWDDVERLRRHLGGAAEARGAFAPAPGTSLPAMASPGIPTPAPPPDRGARLDALPFAKSDGPPSSRTSTALRSFAAPAERRGTPTMDARSLQQALHGVDASPSWLTPQPARSSPEAAIPSAPRPSQMPPSLSARPAPAVPSFGTPPPAPAVPGPPPLPVQGIPEPARAPAPPPAVVPPPLPVFASLAPSSPMSVVVPPPLPSLAATPPPPAIAIAPAPAPAPAQPAPPPGLRARPMSDAARPASGSNGALEASNAAAQLQDRPGPRPAAPSRGEAAVTAPRQPPGECVDLVWFDPEALDRARAIPQLRSLFAAEKKGTEAWLNDGITSPAAPEQRDRLAALRALTRGRSLDDGELTQAMADGVTNEGAFTAPVAVVAGELHFRFDELETLKATVAAVAPFTAGDKKLKDLSDSAGELLRSAWAASAAGMADAMTLRLREAFAQQSRSLPPGYLERTVDRSLLEQRRYQKRSVLGGEMIRALLFASGGSTPVPAYLPEAIGAKLPLFPSFKATVLAAVTTTQDQSEPHPAALHVIALGRVMPTPGRALASPAR